jgi:hypothetical protein
MTKHETKRIDRADGKRSVTITAREDGLYQYEEWGEDFEDLRGIGLSIERIWVPFAFSGVFGSAEDAERDARLTVQWLRENSDE